MSQTTTIAEDLTVGVRLRRLASAERTLYCIARICTDGQDHTLYQTAEVHEAMEEYLRARAAAYGDMIRALIPDDFRKKWPHG